MPSKSKSQARLMAAICNGGEEYRQKLIRMGMKNPPSVRTACEFHKHDKNIAILRGKKTKK